MKKVYVKHHPLYAGKWIYEGFYSAWQSLGYDTQYYTSLSEIEGEDFYLMAIDPDLDSQAIEVFKRSRKTFLFVRPTHFAHHWGRHPNFVFDKPKKIISELSVLQNVVKWTFCETDQTEYFSEWGVVETVPLAFDNINYKKQINKKYEYDVCFVGGWANNGFDEKRRIITSWMKPFINSKLKCGFFVNRGVSHEFESLLISNSKVAINLHDAYQQELGLDTNERTFKSLGLNGLLVVDNIHQIKKYFSNVPLVKTPVEMLNEVQKYVKMDPVERDLLKQKNIKFVYKNHTYVNRVKQLLSL